MHCVSHMALLHIVARDKNLGFTQRSMILTQQVVRNFSLNLTRKVQVKCWTMYMVFYPLQAKFTCFKQKGGLLFPSISLLKILKAAEVTFWRRVIEQGKGICFDKNLSAAIQSAVVEQLGSAMFEQSQEHFFDHSLSIEADHLTTLLCCYTWRHTVRDLQRWWLTKMSLLSDTGWQKPSCLRTSKISVK